MYNAYINNIFNNTIAVLISVTDNLELKQYEKDMLYQYRNKIINHLCLYVYLEDCNPVRLFFATKRSNLYAYSGLYDYSGHKSRDSSVDVASSLCPVL